MNLKEATMNDLRQMINEEIKELLPEGEEQLSEEQIRAVIHVLDKKDALTNKEESSMAKVIVALLDANAEKDKLLNDIRGKFLNKLFYIVAMLSLTVIGLIITRMLPQVEIMDLLP